MQTYGQPLKVGGDVKYLCPKCNLELAHTILAIVKGEPARIKCNTCGSERNYRAKKAMEAVLNPGTPRPKIRDASLYEQKLQENVAKTPKDYRIDQEFELNDVIQHVKFGKGIVIRLTYPDRMEVLFQDESRVLMCKVPDKPPAPSL